MEVEVYRRRKYAHQALAGTTFPEGLKGQFAYRCVGNNHEIVQECVCGRGGGAGSGLDGLGGLDESSMRMQLPHEGNKWFNEGGNDSQTCKTNTFYLAFHTATIKNKISAIFGAFICV